MSTSRAIHNQQRYRQSRSGSLLEATANVLLACVMHGLIYPLLGIITTAQTTHDRARLLR